MEASSQRRSGLMTEEIFLSIEGGAFWLVHQFKDPPKRRYTRETRPARAPAPTSRPLTYPPENSGRWLMTFGQEAEHPIRCHGFLLVNRRANKKRGGGVREADGFSYRYPAGEAGGQGADERVARAVSID